ncbi:glycoside hydrolase family 6 protein [Streptomyces aidingensis]|uniref:Glucanase n=1 Tax=Streptomyces aidingensis TaxID=910347 RepID=A0A1I1S232_9ACTN|nr:glycoside hydrolase family 6 protein [Streptomyces aidingensis]SFD40392.1 cellulose 1,4-beta-cellobiosidase [Streptomyces aidingensis]
MSLSHLDDWLSRLGWRRRGGRLAAAAVAASLLAAPAPAVSGTAPALGAESRDGGRPAAGPAGPRQPRADNPYAGVRVYVDPEWAARARAHPGGAAVAGLPTAVWIDRAAAVHGAGGTGGRTMGLRDHLDAALAQGAGLIQLVLHNLPGRSCARPAWHGELGPGDIGRYRTEFIDPIADILGDPAYASLRVVAVIEPESLSSLVLHTRPRQPAIALCETMKANGNYLAGIGYALGRLGDLPQVYLYLDAGHHGALGRPDSRIPVAQLFYQAATTAGARPADVHGFTVNLAGYGALREPFLHLTDTVHGTPVHDSRWIGGNRHLDELSYARTLREQLVSFGFGSGIGMIVDTSRNGWGGPDRPTGPAAGAPGVDSHVNASRLDRRHSSTHWCNQENAGLGERPAASPGPGIDAYAWLKPPGESDGSAAGFPGAAGRRADPMCAPRHPAGPTGALPGGPPFGRWFPEHFTRLLANAQPPL